MSNKNIFDQAADKVKEALQEINDFLEKHGSAPEGKPTFNPDGEVIHEKDEEVIEAIDDSEMDDVEAVVNDVLPVEEPVVPTPAPVANTEVVDKPE